MPDYPVLIALAGPSCSGKTSLAAALARSLPGAPHGVLSTDAYYRDLGRLPLHERAAANFDAPEAFDWPLLRQHVRRLASGEAVEVPVYDFTIHARAPHQVQRVLATPFVIVEGLYALYDPEVRACCTVLAWVEVPEEVCLARRIARDVAERGRTEACVREQFAATVSPMYRRHIAPTRHYADVVLDGLVPTEALARQVAERILAYRP